VAEYPIASDVDVFGACRGARELAAAIGFLRLECEQIAIVVSELATNILKYGIRGAIAVQEVDDPARGRGLRITATDRGPPFHDLQMALLDGHDDRGKIDPAAMFKRRGLGCGLGAVVRFTHSFEYETLSEGKQLRVVRYLRPGAVGRANRT
jgi:anti-sigma regulatory factor (Ser/Thr protein kinase)